MFIKYKLFKIIHTAFQKYIKWVKIYGDNMQMYILYETAEMQYNCITFKNNNYNCLY